MARRHQLRVLEGQLHRPRWQPAGAVDRGVAPLDHGARRDKSTLFGEVTLRYLGGLRHIPVGVVLKNRNVRQLVAAGRTA